MRCPRCGSENGDTRVACWSCFAQLQSAANNKVKKIELANNTPAPMVEVEQNPTVEPEVTDDVVQHEVDDSAVLSTNFIETSSTETFEDQPVVIESGVVEQEAVEPAVIETGFTDTSAIEPVTIEPVEPEPSISEPAVFDLDEPTSESDYFIPGLAEPEPEIEEGVEIETSDDSRPVFDLDAFKDELKAADAEDDLTDEEKA